MAHAFLESFNRRLRDECLNVHPFRLARQDKRHIEARRVDCNHHRLPSSLGDLTPSECVEQRQAIQPVK